jgi:hypothetical protein
VRRGARIFKPGDRVSYCGEEAVVVENYGDSGLVEIPGGGCMRWYWRFEGKAVKLVERAK